MTSPEAVTFGALRSPNFAALWLAQVASRFGDPITLVALAYVSYVQTRSALITALAVVIATVPNALFGVFGGAIADAIDSPPLRSAQERDPHTTGSPEPSGAEGL